VLGKSMKHRLVPAVRDKATAGRVRSVSSPEGSPWLGATAVNNVSGEVLETLLSPSFAQVQAEVDAAAKVRAGRRGRAVYSFMTAETRTARSATLTHKEEDGLKGAE
jgi:hypothetical protein